VRGVGNRKITLPVAPSGNSTYNLAPSHPSPARSIIVTVKQVSFAVFEQAETDESKAQQRVVVKRVLIIVFLVRGVESFARGLWGWG
jgi:hypothetical protein